MADELKEGDDATAATTQLTRHQLKLGASITELRMERPDDDDKAYQHVVLCHLGFPRSRADERSFTRTSGTTSLLLEAGRLWNGKAWEQQELPYGSIPRLMMIAIITRALQEKTQVVNLGNSMTKSLRTLGLSTTGEAHWGRVRVQAKALSAVNMTLGYVADGQPNTLSAKPVKRFEAWAHRDERQLSLIPSEVELTTDFYEALRGASVPLDVRAVRALSKYPLALDVYTWLAHRLCRVRRAKGDPVPWMALRQQFGQEIGNQKDFKKLMRAALKRATEVYPAARLDTFGSGIVLLPSAPPIDRKSVVVPLAFSAGKR